MWSMQYSSFNPLMAAGRRLRDGPFGFPFHGQVLCMLLFHKSEIILHGPVHLLEKHLRIDTHEDDEEDDAAEDQHLSLAEIRHLPVLLPLDLPEHHPLIGPEHIHGTQHNTCCSHDAVDH